MELTPDKDKHMLDKIKPWFCFFVFLAYHARIGGRLLGGAFTLLCALWWRRRRPDSGGGVRISRIGTPRVSRIHLLFFSTLSDFSFLQLIFCAQKWQYKGGHYSHTHF